MYGAVRTPVFPSASLFIGGVRGSRDTAFNDAVCHYVALVMKAA